MEKVELVATTILEVSQLVANLARMLIDPESASFTPEQARAEIDRFISDVKIDDAIERRTFERERAERDAGKT